MQEMEKVVEEKKELISIRRDDCEIRRVDAHVPSCSMKAYIEQTEILLPKRAN